MSNEFTLSDAEKTFKSFGCNHFHMYRDEPDLHKRYLKLNVTKEQEREWTKGSFYELIIALESSNTAKENLWWLYSRATTLAGYLSEVEVLQALENASEKLLKYIPASKAINCAASILDSRDISQKCSVIFISESIKQPELADKLIERTKDFIDLYQHTDQAHSNSLLERLKKTKAMLNINRTAPNKLLKRN